MGGGHVGVYFAGEVPVGGNLLGEGGEIVLAQGKHGDDSEGLDQDDEVVCFHVRLGYEYA